MPKVTYLLGAGASCKCLPTVDEIPNCLDDLFHLFTNHPYPSDQHALTKLHTFIVNEIAEFKAGVRSTSSVDAYIKDIFIETHGSTNNDKLISAKVLLTFSFIYEQIRNPTDPRYRTFFTKILKTDTSSLNENVRIISWNYDFQFEKAFAQRIKSHSLTHIQEKLRVLPRSLNPVDYAEKFSIFKLNGTTSFYDSRMQEIMHPLEELALTEIVRAEPLKDGVFKEPVKLSEETQAKLVHEFCDIYLKVPQSTNILTPMLSFAWEDVAPRKLIDEAFNRCLMSISETKSLVVIGYSFPDFNKKIDKAILGKLHHRAPIYIQNPRFDEVEETLKFLLPPTSKNEIIRVTNLKDFHIPNELVI